MRPDRRPLATLWLAALWLSAFVPEARPDEVPASAARASESQPSSSLGATAADPAAGVVHRGLVAIDAYAADDGASPFVEPLRAALARELSAAGFPAGEEAAAEGEPVAGNKPVAGSAAAAEAAPVASEAPRWRVDARCATDGGRIVWLIRVTDGDGGPVVAAASGYAFAGLSAVAALEEAAAELAEDLALSAAAAERRTAAGFRLSFQSMDEGASLRFGSADGPRAGTVVSGGLRAPYLPFSADDEVTVSLTRRGYRPRTVSVSLGEGEAPVPVPPLMLEARHALALGTSYGRAVGASAEYRYFFEPDSVFARMGAQLWRRPGTGAGQQAVAHQEYRLGVGAYLFLPPGSAVRVAAGAGASGLLTALSGDDLVHKDFFDAALDFPWLSLEWHEPRLAAFIEQRWSYSAGLDSGLLRQGWLDAGSMPFTVSVGVMYKWP